MQDGQTQNADSAEELVALQQRIRELEAKQSGRAAELSGARQRFEHLFAVSPAIIYATHASGDFDCTYGSFRQKLKSRVEHRCDRPCASRFITSTAQIYLDRPPHAEDESGNNAPFSRVRQTGRTRRFLQRGSFGNAVVHFSNH
jgi:hypothetical protein